MPSSGNRRISSRARPAAARPQRRRGAEVLRRQRHALGKTIVVVSDFLVDAVETYRRLSSEIAEVERANE